MLDLRRLSLLHQFSLRGSIAATADALGFSPSAVSQQLSVLEREVGVELLERTPRSARLTPAGVLLAEQAVGLLAAAETLESDVLALAAETVGPITVAVIPSVAAQVSRRLAAVARDHPRVEISLRQAETDVAIGLLERGDLDVAVVDAWPRVPVPTFEGLRRLEIGRDRLVLALPGGDGPTPKTLTTSQVRELVRDRTWLCAPPGHASRDYGDQMLRTSATEPRNRWEFEGLLTIATLVADGTGVAVLPRSTLQLVTARVNAHPLGKVRRLHAAVRASHARRPAVAAVLRRLRAEPLI